jgi:DNA replication regulator SLD3
MRPAASVAVPPGIKREDSDSSLLSKLSASKLDSDSSSSRRSSLVRSSSMADLHDPKVAKKAKVEAELKDAISALRKPNRECVGKAMAEADQRRASTLFSTKGIVLHLHSRVRTMMLIFSSSAQAIPPFY